MITTKWLSSLPTEFQFGLAIVLIGVACWANCFWCERLHDSIGTVLIFLGTISTTVIGHGAITRSKLGQPDSTKDLIGTIEGTITKL